MSSSSDDFDAFRAAELGEGGPPPAPPACPEPGRGAPATPTPPPPAGSDSPLTAEHIQQLRDAETRAKKLRKAARMAAFNGGTFAFFAVVSFLIAMISLARGEWDVVGFVMGAGLAVVAWNELRGKKLLQQFDAKGPRLLGWNQIGLMGLILAYCAYMIAAAYVGPGPYEDTMQKYPSLRRSLGDIDKLHQSITVLVYGAVIVGTILYQGGCAWYYFARGKLLADYLAETPPWVVDVQRTGPS